MITKLVCFIIIVSSSSPAEVNDGISANTRLIEGNCTLPPYPKRGTYVTNIQNGKPGEKYNYVIFDVTCDEGYKVPKLQPICYNGYWNGPEPTCVPINEDNIRPSKNFSLFSPPYTRRPSTLRPSTIPPTYSAPPKQSGTKGNCVLPPQPAHGSYVTDHTNSKPGDRHHYVIFETTCDEGYTVPGGLQATCYNGYWNGAKPECVLDKTKPTRQKLATTTTVTTIAPTTRTAATSTRATESNSCILPQFPPYASYSTNIPGAKPGEAYGIVAVNFTCQEGYIADGPNFVFCDSGRWSSQIPQCVSQCRLPLHPSVEYRCLVSLEWMDGFRACNEYEPASTQVRPFCRPHYYSTVALKFMHCVNGEWSNIQKCTPECGTLIPSGEQLVLGGETAELGEVPWHAGIYTKTTTPYKQVCGGSIISTNVVISAAHCFWSNLVGKLPASDYAVAVGKLYRHWDSKQDRPQWFDVESLRLPPRFRGSATNYQDDIAVVILSAAIDYNTYIRPVCVDFDASFERRQLQPGNKGKVAGWGLTAENGGPSQRLQVVDLPYVSIQTCIDQSPATFSPFITSDKICAGFNNAGTALCKGDSGGGLAFPELDRGTPRYYLRGVASTAPSNDNLCNANTYTSFTRLINHEHLITRFWGD